jgi:type I restriction enzyme S subunit
LQGGQGNLSGNIVKGIEVPIPTFPEQSRIGTWFQHLDQLISLHQKKYNKLTNIKKAMLEKMFPKNGADVPEIRFEGFEGKWSVKTFGESFTSIPNNSLSRAELNYSSGIAKNIHYGDVLIKYGELLDVCKEAVPFITDDSISKKHLPFKLQEGDVIIADAAEDESVGKCTELVNVDNEIVVSGLHTICVRPLLCFSSKYLGYFLNSPAYHNQLLSLMQGTKVLSISKTTIKGTSILFPVNLKEQQKIGTYFQKLDQLITLQQTQIEKLQNIKKACLEKMFV